MPCSFTFTCLDCPHCKHHTVCERWVAGGSSPRNAWHVMKQQTRCFWGWVQPEKQGQYLHIMEALFYRLSTSTCVCECVCVCAPKVVAWGQTLVSCCRPLSLQLTSQDCLCGLDLGIQPQYFPPKCVIKKCPVLKVSLKCLHRFIILMQTEIVSIGTKIQALHQHLCFSNQS